MKITLFAGTFTLSGVPLAQLKLARAFSARGHQVELIYGNVIDKKNLPKSNKFKIINLKKKRVLFMLFDISRYLRKNNPDIVLTAGDHLNAIVLIAAILTNNKSKISCSSRVTPYDTYSSNFFSKRWILKIIMKLVMYRANVLSCVSKDMVQQYKNIFANSRHLPIYNIVKDDHSKKLILEPLKNDEEIYFSKKKTIITAGMLEPWKRQGDIIQAFNFFRDKNESTLIILGEGSEQKNLSKLIKRLNLENSVFLLGNVKNPLKYFSKADVFVLASSVEGLPNVLVEAMFCGCTPVSTNCPTGPNEVLQNGKYGYLCDVGDIMQISKNIQKAVDFPIPKQKLDEAITEFSEDKVVQKHLDLLKVI
jgi:glycosyltransferase involved in cell wall biosynthesis